jgi:nicotinate-nucleotide--dimethylbenzimidazole phosphoribosyltransferase
MTLLPALPFDLPVIAPTADAALQARLQHKIDHKTKPLGALGRLEGLALQLGLIQRSETVALTQPQMVVFAADHGVAAEGVSAFPQAVTVQMVANMLAGGAAINVFARQHGFALQVVDAGVAADLPAHPKLQQRKVAFGTRNLCMEPAMTPDEALTALHAGMQVVRDLPGNVVAFGEMGIGNTSAAALLLARLAGVPLIDATGRGTGLDDAQLAHKQGVLARALARKPAAAEPLEALADLGGFEIAMMTGAMLQAASERRVVLVDGFIAGAAALVAHALVPVVKDYLVFCHRSAERGHDLLLAHLGAQPLLALDLRLGEGSGALLAWPLVQSAAAFLNEMASFEAAGVSGKAA